MGVSSFLNDLSDRRSARNFEALSNKHNEEELMSWERTLEISQILSKSSDPETVRLAKELEKMAQENASFAQYLGFTKVEEQDALPSGMVFTPAEVEKVAEGLEEDDALEEPVWNGSAVHGPVPELLEPAAPSLKQEVATFKHVCDGRDGKLCLFEDAQGHLVAVRASRLV